MLREALIDLSLIACLFLTVGGLLYVVRLHLWPHRFDQPR
jgi:hypothetical protein